MVDNSHVYANGEVVATIMYAHITGRCGEEGNNVVSLVVKTLESHHLMRESEVGVESNVVFGNYSGQNKTTLCLSY